MSLTDTTGSETTQNTPKQQQSTPALEAPSLLQIIGNASQASRMSAEANKYMEVVMSRWANDSAITVVPITTDRIEARVVCDSKSSSAIVLMFEETYQPCQKDAPPADCWRYVIPRFMAENRSYTNIMPTILVTRRDYERPQQMGVYIESCFSTTLGNTKIASRNTFKNTRISVITNREAVMNFVSQHSPHAVPARCDYGILICVNVATNRRNNYGQPIEESKPIIAVTGYTRFLSPMQTGNGKNIPVSTITDIVSIIPNRFMLSLVLPLAVDAFITQGMVFNPYRNFVDKSAPNIGNLFSDPTGHLDEVHDVAKFNQIITQGCTAPFFGLDITEGRARIVGIDNYVHDINGALKDLSSFLFTEQNKINLNGAPATAIAPFYNFIGTVETQDGPKDSRCIDYLYLISKSPNVEQYANFLRQDIRNPDAQLSDIMTTFSPDKVKPLYITTSLIFNAQLVNAIRVAISDLITINYDQPQSTFLNLTPLLAENTVLNQFEQFAAGNVSTAMNYYNNSFAGNTAFPYSY